MSKVLFHSLGIEWQSRTDWEAPRARGKPETSPSGSRRNLRPGLTQHGVRAVRSYSDYCLPVWTRGSFYAPVVITMLAIIAGRFSFAGLPAGDAMAIR
jgi:hypothetical protein